MKNFNPNLTGEYVSRIEKKALISCGRGLSRGKLRKQDFATRGIRSEKQKISR